MTNAYLAFLALFFFLGSSVVTGQSTSELQKEQRRLQKKIELTAQLVKSNKKDQQNSLAKLKLLKTQISSRKLLLNTYEQELKKIRSQQSAVAKSVRGLERRKDKLASHYSKLLQSSYRSKLTYNRWLFLLSAASFHQMLQRWRYLRHINQAWKKQLATWQKAREDLSSELLKLKEVEKTKANKLKNIKHETSELSKDQGSLDETLARLAKNEKQLLTELRKYRKSSNKLRKAIEAAVSGTTSKRRDLPMTPAMKELAKSFADNKGALPWPVTQGIIARPFGTHPHPTLPNIKIKNNGVDIQTMPGTAVKSIFNGKVIAHQVIPGFDNMIIVAHGNYYTVYSHLVKVSVAIGDQIALGTTIGFASSDDGSKAIHLEIWQGKTILNPAAWLTKN